MVVSWRVIITVVAGWVISLLMSGIISCSILFSSITYELYSYCWCECYIIVSVMEIMIIVDRNNIDHDDGGYYYYCVRT